MSPNPLDYLSRELDDLKRQNLYRRLRVLEGEQKARAVFDSREVINLSSNNYLGLTTHPKLRERALEALREYGVGSGAVASYTALSLANRIRASHGWMRRLWLTAAAVALGGGIWSMHFVAMLAFSMPGMSMS